MGTFERAFAIVVGIEAGFTDDADDPGNWTGGSKGVGELKGTKYGISAKAYPKLDIANLSMSDAQALYQSDYWAAVHGDDLPWPLACLVFDCAVNQGQATARVIAQQALGVAADGIFGPATLTAAAHASTWHAAHFLTLRANRYMALSGFAHYGGGWFNRLFTIALASGVPSAPGASGVAASSGE